MIASNKIEIKKNTVRRKKSKFIHNSENDWSRCYVTKSGSSSIYVKKSLVGEERNIRVKSYVSAPDNTGPNIAIHFNQKIIEFLPRQFHDLYNSIEKSKYILTLEDELDDEIAEKYSAETWRKAISFISKLAIKIFKQTEQIISTPKIYHGPKGSIDIYWENDSFNLLLNIPKNGLGTFYGDDYGANKSEGVFDPLNPINIFPFLVDLK